jgi:tight adherence protein B
VIIPLGVFVVFFLAIVGAYWVFVVRPEELSRGIVRGRLTSREVVKASLQRELLKQQQKLSSISAFDRLLQRNNTKAIKSLIEQAGAKVTVGTVVAGAGVAGLIAFTLVWKFTGWAILGVPAALAAAWIPFAILKRLRTLRIRKFEEQFPEALDLITRALRAGHAFTTGLEMVATEMPAPVREEFRLLYDQQNYGMAFPDALKVFAERMPILDARFFVTAVLIQRESGGNLAEVLENLSSVIRERFRVKRQMRVVSAHGRITGWILVCLPPALGIALTAINQEHRDLMFGETLGIQMMVGAAIMQSIGALIIRKIINVPY